MISALECYRLDLDLLSPVNCKLNSDCAADHTVSLGIYLNIDIMETFLLVVSLDYVSRGLGHILGELSSPPEIQTLKKFLLLAVLHTAERPSGDTRPLDDGHFQESGISRS